MSTNPFDDNHSEEKNEKNDQILGGSANLDDLSFYKDNSSEIRAYATSLISQPVVPAPAAAPPPPPPSLSNKKSQGRAITPVITSYDDINPSPNNGQINSPYSYDFGGRNNDPLPILVGRMRVVNIVLAICSFLFEVPFIILKLFTPAKLILAVYLGFMALMLLGFELHTPKVREFLMDNCGFLYSPIGRSFFIVLMGFVSIAEKSVLQTILGIIYICNGFFTLGMNCYFEDFKKIHESPEQREDVLEYVKEYGVANEWTSISNLAENTSLLNQGAKSGYGNVSAL